MSDEYGTAAPYVHLFSAPMWKELEPMWAAALADAGEGTVVELGAGTGVAQDASAPAHLSCSTPSCPRSPSTFLPCHR